MGAEFEAQDLRAEDLRQLAEPHQLIRRTPGSPKPHKTLGICPKCTTQHADALYFEVLKAGCQATSFCQSFRKRAVRGRDSNFPISSCSWALFRWC